MRKEEEKYEKCALDFCFVYEKKRMRDMLIRDKRKKSVLRAQAPCDERGARAAREKRAREEEQKMLRYVRALHRRRRRSAR